jgi:adenylosuccinate lyase
LPSEGLFDALYARGPVAAQTDGRAWLAAMLDVAALASACAAEGLIPAASAEAIAQACHIDAFDLHAIAAATGDSATPVIAIVAELMAQEHERAAGAWQAEWGTHSDLLTLVGSAAAWSADLLDGLEVDVVRMRENAAGLDGSLDGVAPLIDRALAVTAR